MTGPGSMSGPGWMPSAPPTLGRLLAWHPQPVPVLPLLCLLALVLYLAAVVRLHRRGDGWPWLRTVSFTLGLAAVVSVTGTVIGGYGMELFAVHMVQHMVLSMVAPVPLLLAAPVTLALRALDTDGAEGRARRGLLAVLHSRLAGVLTFPPLSLALFVASLYGLYFTPAFDVLMRTFWGHTLMLLHFLGIGLLFFWPLIGVDPAPRRTPYPLRVIELFLSAPFHAFFGIALMMAPTVLVDFFARLPAAWHLNPVHEQSTAGAIAWAFSEVPTVLVLAALAFQWARSDDRLARQRDRAADRDGDRELLAYNAYLAELAQRP
ncbi:MAG: cytochrome c oxidase assembly protein [Motilibacteraceae bacterium]